jgi:histidinol phosphatase-like enzyme (inositol monophosphatase family)
MDDTDLPSMLEFAVDAARQAGEVTLRYFRQEELEVIGKADGTPVTRADREAEAHLRSLIAARYPSHAILGEEHGASAGSGSAAATRWILDPVDGTFSFVRGVPLYGTLVGLERDGEMILGVIHMPGLGETVWAARGHGAWHQARVPTGLGPVRRARVSSVATLDRSLMCTTSFDYFDRAGVGDVLGELERRCQHSRGWSDCYALLLVATGRVEAVVEPMIHPWDVAAAKPIVEEAGGRYSDWTGDPSVHRPTALVTNGLVHDELVVLLRPAAMEIG